MAHTFVNTLAILLLKSFLEDLKIYFHLYEMSFLYFSITVKPKLLFQIEGYDLQSLIIFPRVIINYSFANMPVIRLVRKIIFI